MTKVLMNQGLRDYQQAMKEELRQVLRNNIITGAPHPYMEETMPVEKHVLPPPCIGWIFLEGYQGQGDDYIGLTASHDFGIHCMRITILDEGGHVIESGEMWPFWEDPNAWEYLPQVCVPPGTAVTVQVTAFDCMGGIGRGWERKTLEEAGED